MRKRSDRNGPTVDPHIFSVLGIDPYRTDIDGLRTIVRALPPATRRRLILSSAAVLQDARTRRQEATRVGAVKLLVAVYPESKEFVRAWLSRADAAAFEVHFSLFCFLDAIPRGRRELVQWVHRYLTDVKSDAAHAAWMAGDLLGDHWPLSLSLPVLTDAARTARFAAGRAGALHGLDSAARRVSATDPRSRAIRRVLGDVRQHDRSASVRTQAASIARRLRRS